MTNATRPRRRLFVLAAALLVATGILLTKDPPPPTPTPAGSFTFGVLGDAPYFDWEALQFRLVLADINAHDLDLVVHVGDIFWRPCSDAMYQRALSRLNGIRHPVLYTPGDNEWTDCWERRVGGYSPLERLTRLRAVFFVDPTTSLGAAPVSIDTQSREGEFAEFVENARWSHRGLVFATLHLVGSRNARDTFPGRTADDDAEADRRTTAAVAWMRGTFDEAITSNATAVVLAFHANPGFEEPIGNSYRQGYEPFIEALEEEVARYGGPVLMAHGDNHEYLVDHPLVRRATGERLENLTRMQVPGSPRVGWVRVVVTPGDPVRFAFESRVVPRWKYW